MRRGEKINEESVGRSLGGGWTAGPSKEAARGPWPLALRGKPPASRVSTAHPSLAAHSPRRGGGRGCSHPPNFTVPALEPPRTQPGSPLQEQQGRGRREPIPAVLYSVQPPQKEFGPRVPSHWRHPTPNRAETLPEASAPSLLPRRAPPRAPPYASLPHASGSALLIGHLPRQSERCQRITL